MLVRIKFSSNSKDNKLIKNDLDRLVDFLGENVSASQMKINEKGEPEIVNWRETFNKEIVEKDNDYVLVIPSEYYVITSNETYIVNLEIFTLEFPNLEVSIKGVPKSILSKDLDLIEEMNKIATKIEEAKNRFEKVVELNQQCNIHVPNLGLLNVNKMAYATDYCTEMLQERLLQGWRLIAVCPQPDQRRPDYILGMHVDELDENVVSVEHYYGNGREKGLQARDARKKEEFSL
jgi:hypothetical protein